MNIAIYEDHAFLITNLDRVMEHYACAVSSKIYTSRQSAAARRGLYQGGKQGGVPRRANPIARNGIRKSTFWEENLWW